MNDDVLPAWRDTNGCTLQRDFGIAAAGLGAGLPNTYPTVQAAVETAGKDARWRTR
jgi:hypothetical protein